MVACRSQKGRPCGSTNEHHLFRTDLWPVVGRAFSSVTKPQHGRHQGRARTAGCLASVSSDVSAALAMDSTGQTLAMPQCAPHPCSAEKAANMGPGLAGGQQLGPACMLGFRDKRHPSLSPGKRTYWNVQHN